jgi:hypothetical protein
MKRVLPRGSHPIPPAIPPRLAGFQQPAVALMSFPRNHSCRRSTCHQNKPSGFQKGSSLPPRPRPQRKVIVISERMMAPSMAQKPRLAASSSGRERLPAKALRRTCEWIPHRSSIYSNNIPVNTNCSLNRSSRRRHCLINIRSERNS